MLNLIGTLVSFPLQIVSFWIDGCIVIVYFCKYHFNTFVDECGPITLDNAAVFWLQ